MIVKGLTKKNQLWMCKLKTREWIEKVQLKMAGNLKMYDGDIKSIEIEVDSFIHCLWM